MTTLQNRPKTALLVIDVQKGVVHGAHQRDAVVANVSSLVDRARSEGVPVVWIQHSDEDLARGSDKWRIVPELTPGEAEPLVEKNYGDSFEATTLETVLSGLGVGRLIVVGAQTDMCVRSTLHGAFVRGYDATLVKDAHTTEDLTEWGAPPPDKVIHVTAVGPRRGKAEAGAGEVLAIGVGQLRPPAVPTVEMRQLDAQHRGLDGIEPVIQGKRDVLVFRGRAVIAEDAGGGRHP